jgi:transcription elongation GreA/GreB family factor
MVMDIWQKTYQAFDKLLNEKINVLKKQADDLQQSIASETKSSVGDKYETSRAMLHLEQEKNNHYLREAQDQRSVLHILEHHTPTQKVTAGSLVKTNKGWFFISGAFGKASLDIGIVMAISSISPLGKSLADHKVGDSIKVLETTYTIEAIY